MALPAKLWRLSPGQGLTALLAVTALAMVTLAGVRAWTRLRQRTPADAAHPPPAASAPEPLFRDVTAQAGISFRHVNDARGQFRLPEEMGAGAGFLDCDSDGDLDLYLVQGGSLEGDPAPRNVLLLNDGTGRFEDVSDGSGADLPGFGMGCAMADVDNDADVDILVTRLGPAALLLNDGSCRFRDATTECGVSISGFGASACFFDYDRDGWLDVYVANYVEWSPGIEKPCYDAAGARDYCSPTEYRAPAADRLLHNLGAGRFEDVTQSSGVGGVAGHSLGLACSDFSADGYVDVFVASDQTPGLLWVNNGGDGTFREDAALRGCAFSGDGLAIAGMGTAAEDFDADGDFDLLVTNLHDLIDLALRNDAGLFEDVSHAWGLDGWGVPYTGFGLVAFDQDHDGRQDLVVNNGAVLRLGVSRFPGHDYAEPAQFVRWTEEGRFADFTEAAGPALGQPCVGRAAATGDVDGDGDIDVLLTCNGGSARLLRNENRSGGAWVILDLVPRGGGRHALNARVEVQAGGRRWLREVRPHTSYLSSHDPRVHLGMGEVKRIDRLIVTWPNGSQEQWIDLPVNRVLRIEQGTGTAP